MPNFVRKPTLWLMLLPALLVGALGLWLMQTDAVASLDGRGRWDPADNDSDGMSDEWELYYFGSVGARSGGEDDDLDDINTLDEWLADTHPLELDPRSVGECGTVTLSQAQVNIWHTVRFNGTYENPIVVMGAASSRGQHPITLRIRRVSSTLFEFQFDEFEYQDGPHNTESVSWLVVEEGVHALPGGMTMQAGRGQVDANGARINFPQSFATTTWPVVFSQVTSRNGGAATLPRHYGVQRSGFSVILHNQETWQTHGATEDIDWISFGHGKADGVAGPLDVFWTGIEVTGEWYQLDFRKTFAQKPAFLAMMTAIAGADTANVRYQTLSTTGAVIKIKEEQSADTETAHIAENVGYLAAAHGMFHILPTTGDTDADGLADAWETANGLVVGVITPSDGYYGDLDGDGLNNAAEYRAVTRADLADTDGDGISDFDEINFYTSDALAADVGAFEPVAVVNGAAFSGSSGHWQSIGTLGAQSGARGWVEYPLTVTAAGVHALDLVLSPRLGANFSHSYEVLISIDGEELSREQITIAQGEQGTARVLTPWLLEGGHSVRIFIDNSYTYRRVNIESLTLLAATGVDSNGNQIPDWTEIRTIANNGVDVGNLTFTNGVSHANSSRPWLNGAATMGNNPNASTVYESPTSPVCLEGRARYLGTITNDAGLSLKAAPDDRWYADFALDPITPTSITFDFENGAFQQTHRVRWVPTNLLEEGSVSLRHGDSLLLSAYDGSFPTSSDQVTLTVEGQSYSFTADNPLTYTFANPGSHTISVSHSIGQSNHITTREVVIEVAGPVTLESPACVLGYERPWNITGLPENAIVQIDGRIGVFEGTRLGTSGWSYTIAANEARARPAVVRLGYHGPILASTTITGMSLRFADKTSVTFLEQYPDGDMKVAMPVVVHPVIPGVEVECELYLSGVHYLDGSLSKTLQAGDFDEMGSYTLLFVAPPAIASNCHRFKVWQNGVLLCYTN